MSHLECPGAGAPARQLIVNADDFGMSSGVNRGIVEAHTAGIVTSTSLMVRWVGAQEAVALWRSHPALGLGLHVDLGSWTYEDQEWRATYEVVDLGDVMATKMEVDRQLARFERLVGRSPDHLNSHQHVHRDEPVASIVADAARHRGVPVRDDPEIRYCGEFYGQGRQGDPIPEAVSVDALLEVLDGLPDGTTELCCHPGYADGLDSSYAAEREVELRTLCDARVVAAVREGGILLRRFADVPRDG